MNPAEIAVGPHGTVYVGDYTLHRVEEFAPDGNLSRALRPRLRAAEQSDRPGDGRCCRTSARIILRSISHSAIRSGYRPGAERAMGTSTRGKEGHVDTRCRHLTHDWIRRREYRSDRLG